jgi:hypothetical protein
MTKKMKKCSICGKLFAQAWQVAQHHRLDHPRLMKKKADEKIKLKTGHNNTTQDKEDSTVAVAIGFAQGRCEETIREVASRTGLPFDVIATGVTNYLLPFKKRAA